ncbi:MAG: hypothetical protein WCV70_02615 [Patescibacteria group bacterium]|jgi:hypothetical protein
MADIKPEIASGEKLSLNEKPLVDGDKLKQSLERIGSEEKINNLEQSRQTVASEIAQAENRPAAVIAPATGIIAPAARRQKQVENILVSGLADIYLSLTPAKRQEFKKAGEETARKINQLLSKAKVNIGDIIKLIKKWLMLIPGVNKYFLEQEAKIKADEIMKMKNENK